MNFATFGTLPDGLSYGTVFELADDTTELMTGNWAGWAVYVQSDQSTYFDGSDPSGFVRFPTNQWRSLSGAGGRAFSVDARGSIKVYLCYHDPLAECWEADSVEFFVNGNAGGQAIDWTGSPFTHAGAVTGNANEFVPDIFNTQGIGGWTVEVFDGGAWMNWSGQGGDANRERIEPGIPHTIPSPAPFLHFYDPQFPFRVKICPPGEGGT